MATLTATPFGSMPRSTPSAVLAASLLAMALSLWQRDRLPDAQGLLPPLHEEPRQTQVDVRAFAVRAGDVEYTVKPLYEYEIQGLVVSRHDTSAFWDVVHRKDWQDHLNVADVCLIWGRNVADDGYRALRYWNEVFTCNVATDSDEVWSRFDQNSLSNNHLLASDPRMAKLLRDVRPGDQVRIRGYLAEYSHDHGREFRRGTSIVRTDRGNGACETVWVTDAEVLRAANRGWRMLLRFSFAGVAIAMLLWLVAPLRLADD